MRPTVRLLAVAVSSVLSLGALAAPASAASPARVSASPAAGSFVKTAPSGISVTFDQSVATSSTLTVGAPAGTSPCVRTAMASPGPTLACTFNGVPRATVNDGTYTVSYTADSTGTDAPTTNSYTFVLDTVAPAAPTALVITPSPYLAASDGLTVTGVSERADDVVRVTLSGGASISTDVTPASDRSFAATFTQAQVASLADGTITASVRSTDRAGNLGAAATRTAVKDASRATVVSTDPVDGGSKKKASFSYLATASENLAASSRVSLFDRTDTQIAATVVVSNATVRATPGSLPDGTYRAEIVLVDTFGNVSPTVSRSFTIDDAAPAAPVVTTPAPVINKANVSAYPVSGTGEPGATLTTRAGTGVTSVTKVVTVGPGGTWSTALDVSALADGSVPLTATQTDAAGNTSPTSQAAPTTKDTVSPAVSGPAVTPARMGLGTTTATVSASTNDGSVPAPGAPAESVPVRVSADDTDPTTPAVVTTTTSASNGSFSVTLDTGSLSDGTITYSITATDAAGNPSATVTTTNTKNTVAPAAPTVTVTPTPINNANKAAITVSGAATGASASITLSDGTTTLGPTTVTISNGTYSQSFNTTTLADGTITVSVTVRDAAGNVGPPATTTAAKDVVAPPAPTSVVVPAFVTSGTLPVSGGAEPGSTVRVAATDSAVPPATATKTVVTGSDGRWSLDLNVSGLAEGSLSVASTATDAAGNTGPATTRTTTKDTAAPDQPATLSGAPAPYLPTSTTFTVSGTTSAADRAATLTARVVVSDTDDATPDLIADRVTVTTGGVSGSFSKVFTAAEMATLTDGALTLAATLTDAAGNVSAVRSASVVKDATVLALVSTTPDTAPNGTGGTEVGLSNDNTATSATFNEPITPTTNATATRSRISITNRTGVVLAGSGAVTGRRITFTPSSPFSDAGGPFLVTVHAVDAANTAETTDVTYSFDVDTAPPATPTITAATDPVTAANQATATVAGSVEAAGLPVTVRVGGATATATSGAGGAYTVGLDLTGAPEGDLEVRVTVSDAAGNTSQAATRSIRKDTVAPTGISATPTDGTRVQPPATVRIRFSEPLGTGTITVPGTAGSTAVDGNDLVFTPTASLPDGTVTATASATDLVGNTGSSTTTFTVDGSAPTAPAITTVTDPINRANRTSVSVAGTSAESGLLITVTAGSVTATATSGDGGGWSISGLDLTALPEGTVSFTATARDEVGNTSATGAAVTATKDTVSPDVVSAVPLTGSTVQPPAVVRFTFSEPLAAGSVVIPGASGSSTVSGSSVTFTPDAPLADGSYTATASATDVAGNLGDAGTSFTVDGTGPGITALAATATNAATATTTVSGTTEAGATLTITVSDGVSTVSGTATAGPQGGFSASLDVAGLMDGTATVSAVATDGRGNAGPAATTTTTRDATAPTVTGLGASDTTTGSPRTTVTGTRSEQSTVDVSATDGVRTVTGQVTLGNDGFSVELDLGSFSTGVVTISATPTDAAGNPGTTVTTTSMHRAEASTTTLDPLPAQVVIGSPLTLTGSVERVALGASGEVRLTATTSNGAVVDLGAVPLGDDGRFTLDVEPSANADYAATYQGDGANTASTSPTRHVDVAPRLRASSKKGKATRKALVKATVRPATTGTRVLLFTVEGSTLTRVGATRVKDGGAIRLKVKLPKGRTTLELQVAATADNATVTTRLTARRR